MTRPKRRSLLFVPAIKEKFYKKALNSEADGVIFDLDDSVAPPVKEAARQTLRQYFPLDYDGPKELAIRINSVTSPFYHDDLALIAELQPTTLVLPKVEQALDLQRLDSFLAACEADGGRPIELLIFIETLRGFYNVAEILPASPRVTAVTLGTEDLCSEMGIARESLPRSPILQQIQVEVTMRCHLYGLQCIGPVFRGFGSEENLAALAEESQFLKQLNARGQLAIHPSQIAVLNEVFNITAAEITAAKETLAQFATTAEQEGTAVISRNQQMEDTPSVVRAKNLLDYAKTHGFIDAEASL